jgi:hypothetical protein
MATNPLHPQKVLKCGGRACAKCGQCHDWYWKPHGKTKSYTKRLDGTCTASYGYGLPGYGPGCVGCCLCIIRPCPFGWVCAPNYFGGGGYGHGGGVALSGFLRGGLKENLDRLAGVDVDARRSRRENADLADLALGGAARFASDLTEFAQANSGARIALGRAHHDDGRLCECSDNQQ